ncbi:hypothetical protein TNCV_730951 [Trichonephila clavipes]|nr:hypothetical protein TNCV_730951 [Trichonephila clavipes]
MLNMPRPKVLSLALCGSSAQIRLGIIIPSLIAERDLNKGSHLKVFAVSDIAALNEELTCEELNPEEWNVYRKGGSSMGTKQVAMRNAPLDFSSRYQEEFGGGNGFQ